MPRVSEREPHTRLPADGLAWGLRGAFTLGTSDFYGDLGAATESDSRCRLCSGLYPESLLSCAAILFPKCLLGGLVDTRWVYTVQKTEVAPRSPGVYRLVTETGVKQTPNKYLMINAGECWPRSKEAWGGDARGNRARRQE